MLCSGIATAVLFAIFFFFQAEDGIRDGHVTGVQTCALPIFGDYQNLEVEVDALEITEAEVEKSLTEMRERAATFVPVEGRPIADGDYAQIELVGTPVGGGEPLRGENVLCHIGAEETLGAVSENLRGAQTGDHRRFEVRYPEDFPDPKLAGKVYTYAIEIVANKEKKLPELNDEFAKDVSEAATLEELRGNIRQNLEAERDLRRTHQRSEERRVGKEGGSR